MLKISALPVVTQSISFPFQDDDGVEPSLDVVFRIQPMKDGKEAELDTEDKQRAFFRKAILKIHGLIGDDDKPVVDHEPWLDALLDRFEIRTALFRAYFRAREEAAKGN
jgi:hypothetical protein